MNKELKRVLEDKLETITVSNAISAEDVLSLESMVADLDGSETYNGFITKDIPIHKFSMRPSTTNLEPVKVKITSILSSFRDTETKINSNSARIFRNNLWSLEALFGNLAYGVESVMKIPTEVISTLKEFKYTTVDGDIFIDHGPEVEFIKAVLETNLKDIFFTGGVVPEYLIHPVDDIPGVVNEVTYTMNGQVYSVNANDASWGIIAYLLDKDIDNMKPVNFIGDFLSPIEPLSVTRGYTMTIQDIVNLYGKAESISNLLNEVIKILRGAQHAFYSSDYLKILASTKTEDSYALNPELCPVRDLIQILKDCPMYPELGDNVDRTFDIIKNAPLK